jgi:hypothetical protein
MFDRYSPFYYSQESRDQRRSLARQWFASASPFWSNLLVVLKNPMILLPSR